MNSASYLIHSHNLHAIIILFKGANSVVREDDSCWEILANIKMIRENNWAQLCQSTFEIKWLNFKMVVEFVMKCYMIKLFLVVNCYI